MLSRRHFLGVLGLSAAPAALAGCSDSGSGGGAASGSADNDGMPTAEKITYGSDASQFGELTRPTHPFHAGTVVIIHGGFWQSAYDLSLGRPLAADLASHGYTAWNLEYRRVGNGGGWPTTLQDIADGIDHLATIGADTSAVAVVGHSAGGQLAVWAAGRSKLHAGDPGSSPKVAVTGVVSQAGVLDLATAARDGVGGGAPQQLAGGEPDTVPDHYRVADPIQQVPITAPVYCLHSQADKNVPYAQSTAYVAAATKAGGKAALHETQGDHFTLIDPTSSAWTAARDALPGLLEGRLP